MGSNWNGSCLGKGGGVTGVLDVFIFLFGCWFVSEKDVPQGAPNCFVEVAAQRIVTQELDRKAGTADEGPQNPRELAAEQKIAA
jgi:hypothetical protein